MLPPPVGAGRSLSCSPPSAPQNWHLQLLPKVLGLIFFFLIPTKIFSPQKRFLTQLLDGNLWANYLGSSGRCFYQVTTQGFCLQVANPIAREQVGFGASTGAPVRAGVCWSSVVGWGGGVLDSVSKLQRGELQDMAEILEMQLCLWAQKCLCNRGNSDRSAEIFNGLCLSSFPSRKEREQCCFTDKKRVLAFCWYCCHSANTPLELADLLQRAAKRGFFFQAGNAHIVGEVMLPGARQGMLAAAERLQHTGMKDVVLWLCQGPGCSMCAGAVFCIRIYCLSTFFPLIKSILSLMALYWSLSHYCPVG